GARAAPVRRPRPAGRAACEADPARPGRLRAAAPVTTAHLSLGVVGFDVLVLLTGYAVLHGLGLARGTSALRLVGLAYLLGWGSLGILLSYMLIAGIPLETGSVLALAAVV